MHRLYLTLTFLLLPCLPVSAQTQEPKKTTVAYLRQLQQPDGGFAPALSKGEARSSLRATSAALRALKYFGGDVPDRQAFEKYVASCIDQKTGGFVDHPGDKPDVAVTSVGMMVLAELKKPATAVTVHEAAAAEYVMVSAKTYEEIRIAAAAFEALGHRPPQAKDWLKVVADMRSKDGTYGTGDGQARATGGAVACWLRLGGAIDNPAAILAAMKNGQRADGGFGREKTEKSDLETSYRVMRSFHMLKAKPDAEKLRGFVARCRNTDGGYGLAPGQLSTVSGTYFAGIILHWLE